MCVKVKWVALKILWMVLFKVPCWILFCFWSMLIMLPILFIAVVRLLLTTKLYLSFPQMHVYQFYRKWRNCKEIWTRFLSCNLLKSLAYYQQVCSYEIWCMQMLITGGILIIAYMANCWNLLPLIEILAC